MPIKPSETLKPSPEDIKRIDALQKIIDEKLNFFDPEDPETITIWLNGSEWFLRGDSLTKPQLKELKRRYGEHWEIGQDYNRDGWSLDFTAK